MSDRAKKLFERAKAAAVLSTSLECYLADGHAIDHPGLQPMLRLKSLLDKQIAH